MRDGDRWLSGSDGTEVHRGRDLGPVSTRNTSKGALIPEAQTVFRALAAGATLADARAQCLAGQLLRQYAFETRRFIWNALHWRYFVWSPPRWMLADLEEAARGDAANPRFVRLLYIHYVRRDRLTFEFVTERLWRLWKTRKMEVGRDNVLDFLAEHEQRSRQIQKWRESTRKKLAGNTLSALRDFGLLVGSQRKTLQRPVVPLEVSLHLCRLLYAEGLRAHALIDAADWRLFLWDQHDTALALGQLAQRGDIRFERSGRTVVLEVPAHPLGPAAGVLSAGPLPVGSLRAAKPDRLLRE